MKQKCIYPHFQRLASPIEIALASIAANNEKRSSFYLDTLEQHSSGGEDHHQGLARTHRLADGSVYFFLTHSRLSGNHEGQLMQFRYSGPLDGTHISQTNPRTVAPLEQLLHLKESHPSDLLFLPEVNNEDAGYLFVTEEYDRRQLVVYQWQPGSDFSEIGPVFDKFPEKGPAYVFLDLVSDVYFLGAAGVEGYCILFTAHRTDLFPSSRRGEINLSAFVRKGIFNFPSHGQSQVKLIRDSVGQWFLLGFRSDPTDDPNGDDYVDVYGVEFAPFSISPLIFSTHVFFPSGDTGFANTGTHFVEPSGRLLLSSSYRWSEDEGPGTSSYVSRVDECASS
jgi:hypothetical protein